MLNSISPIAKNEILCFQQSLPSPWQGAVPNAFKTINEMRSTLHPLLANPGEIIIGGMWAFFLVVSSVCSVASLRELYNSFTVESSTSDRFEKIGTAVKKIFVDLVGLTGTCAYTAHWSHEAQLISLGTYAPLLRGLGLGGSLIVNSVESGVSVYHIYREKEAILAEQSPAEREKHKQRLCLSLMKLIGNTTMVAWAALGITTIALGLTFSSVFMTLLLGISCLFSFTAYFYEWKLENRPEWFPIPQRN